MAVIRSRSRHDVLVAVVLLASGAGSGCGSTPPPRPNEGADPAPKGSSVPPPSATPPASEPKTPPSSGSRPAAPRDAGGNDAATKAAAAAGWERGRTALVVDLILRSKSFDRGFESALLFLPEMREGVTAALVEQASNLDGRVRERSIEALGAMARLRLVPDAQRARAVEVVSARVRGETSPGAWAAAIHALGNLAGVDAGPAISDALARAVAEDQGPVVRACADVLGDLDYRAAAPALVGAADRVRDRYALRTIVRALGKLGGPEATERLRKALQSPEPADREAAASALGEAGGPAAAAALKTCVVRTDETPSVRRAAIAALERMGGADAVKALDGCLDELRGRRDETALTRDVQETLERVKKR